MNDKMKSFRTAVLSLENDMRCFKTIEIYEVFTALVFGSSISAFEKYTISDLTTYGREIAKMLFSDPEEVELDLFHILKQHIHESDSIELDTMTPANRELFSTLV